MANGFGSLYIGASGLKSSMNGLNTTANNLSNVNTEGYVREQVVYQDTSYIKIGTASVSKQQQGLGVEVGTIVHARDTFLDKAYRTENGRYSFYNASNEATSEVLTYLQESDGEAFQTAISDFYEAFAEFAKDPSDTVNQNLVMQKASLFLSRASAVEKGFEDYQSIINKKIQSDVDRINEIGDTIVSLNKQIQAIEAAKKGSNTAIEQAMNLRDQRDQLIDELSGLADISYKENTDGVVTIDLEGTEFVSEVSYNKIATVVKDQDKGTGFITPYWPHLSDLNNKEYYSVFTTTGVSADNNNDIGEIKALLIARGDSHASYLNFYDENGNAISSDDYEAGISNSIMMNSEAELDTLIHEMITSINNLFSPIDSYSNVYGSKTFYDSTGAEATVTGACYRDADGNLVEITDKNRFCDVNNCAVGSDGALPPRELFTRKGTERYTEVTLTDESGNTLYDADGNEVKAYLYNEEDPAANGCTYTLKSVEVNEEMVERESLLPYKSFVDGQVDYNLGANLEAMWSKQGFNLNPSDVTPASFKEFYTKWIGEIGTTGNIYSTTTTTLQTTTEQIEASRQGVMGVSSDEELTYMIKYQSAYNAASRYINVINEMIEHVVTSLGNG